MSGAVWEDADGATSASRPVASQSLRSVTMNFELHRITLPHLHVHLFLRFRGDRFAGGPIDAKLEQARQTPDLLARRAAALAG